MTETDPSAEVPFDRPTVERVISMIDLTDLDDDHRPDGIEALLSDAAEHHTAAVCVWPRFVARSASELAGRGTAVATVANFPDGSASRRDVLDEVSASLVDGADEIDVVLPWRRFVSGDVEGARSVVEAVASLVHERGKRLKVILETGELPDVASITAATQLAIDGGADFVKTSTGKTATGATPEAVAAMLDVVAADGGRVGIKPSGGVRTVADAVAYLDLASERLGDEWATPATFRFGASGLLAAAVAALD